MWGRGGGEAGRGENEGLIIRLTKEDRREERVKREQQ